MKTKILKSKKGSLTTILLDFWSYIAFVLIVLILYLLFTASSKKVVENKITGLEIKSKSHTTLLNFLKTPIEITIDGEERQMLMADLIVLSESKHEEELERGKLALEKSHEILDKTIGESKWAINVCYPRERLNDQKCWLYLNLNRWESTIKGPEGNLDSESSILIPDYEQDNIEVTMRILK